MALENLIRPTIDTIDDLAPVEVKTESGVLRRYREWQETSLWDAEHEQWEDSFDNDQRFAFAQLTGVLVEEQFDKEKARERYDNLKETELYYSPTKEWLLCLNKNQTSGNSSVYLRDQLLGVFTAGKFDIVEARGLYTSLKQSFLFNNETALWSDGSFESVDQLLGVLAEGLFDMQKARENYDKLQHTPLYDDKTSQWISYIYEDSRIGSASRDANAQLLGIIVEGLFDKKKAREKYAKLKQTELYDKGHEQWLCTLTASQKLSYPAVLIENQLLGLLVEMMLEDGEDFVIQGAPVPAVRRF